MALYGQNAPESADPALTFHAQVTLLLSASPAAHALKAFISTLLMASDAACLNLNALV
jgi:hypothetical protein